MRSRSDWMRELAAHYDVMRRAYPEHELCGPGPAD